MSTADTSNKNNEDFLKLEEILSELSKSFGKDDPYVKELEQRLNKFREDLQEAKTAEDLKRLEKQIHTHLSQLSDKLSKFKSEKHQKEFVALKNVMLNIINQTKPTQVQDTQKEQPRKENPQKKQQPINLAIIDGLKKFLISVNNNFKNIVSSVNQQALVKTNKPTEATKQETVKANLANERLTKPEQGKQIEAITVKPNVKLVENIATHIAEKNNTKTVKNFVDKESSRNFNINNGIDAANKPPATQLEKLIQQAEIEAKHGKACISCK